MNTENLIGKILNVDQLSIDSSKRALESKVIPAVNALISTYDTLASLPAFTQKTWESIQSDHGASIYTQFKDQAEADLKNFKNAAVRHGIMENVEKMIEPFKEAVKRVERSVDDAGISTVRYIDISLSDIVIKDGKPELSLDRITEVYTMKVKNEVQAAIYIAGKAAEKSLIALKKTLESAGMDLTRIDWVGQGHAISFEQIPSNTLTFNDYLVSVG